MEKAAEIPIGNKVAPLAVRDRRTRESRRMEAVYAELVAQLGGRGAVSPAMAGLIERAAAIRVHLEQIDGRALKGGIQAGDIDTYVRLNGTYARVLRAIGLKPAPSSAGFDPNVAALARRARSVS